MHIVDRLVLPFFALRRVLLVQRPSSSDDPGRGPAVARAIPRSGALALVWLATQVVVLVQLWFDGGPGQAAGDLMFSRQPAPRSTRHRPG